MDCTHEIVHKEEGDFCHLDCLKCNYSMPCGSFDCLSLHDQILAIEFLREQET